MRVTAFLYFVNNQFHCIYECARVPLSAQGVIRQMAALYTSSASPGINTRLGNPQVHYLVQATWPLQPSVSWRLNPDDIFISALYFSIIFPSADLSPKYTHTLPSILCVFFMSNNSILKYWDTR